MNNAKKLAMRLKIDAKTASELVSAGLGTPKLIRGLSDETLEKKGFEPVTVKEIKAGIESEPKEK